MIKFVFDYDSSRNMGIVKSDYLDNLREHFSVEDKIASIKKMRYGSFMPSRHYAITQAGRFKLGLFSEIANYIRGLDIPYKIIVTKPLREAFFAKYNNIKLSTLNIPLREYQEAALIKALHQGNGVIEIGTGGGKTLLMASIVNVIRNISPKTHNTLIIVPSIQLVEQTYNDFLTYGINKQDISKWSGTNPYSNTPIIIASLSILQSKNTNASTYENVDLLLFDECHKLKRQNQVNKIVYKIKTKNKFGFSGTLPENKIDEWNIIGTFGPLLYKKTSKELRDEDYISDAVIQVIKLSYKTPLVYKHRSSFLDPSARYNEEYEYIFKQPYRNTVISNIANKVDNNILILVDRIEHGEILTEEIKKIIEDKEVYFIRGSVDVEDREVIRNLMETKNNIICIAITSIFSTGINIKNLHYILFAAAGKAKIKIIQSIGRGLRLHENKDNLIIFDICDDLEYSINHLVKRLSLYKKEKIKYVIKKINEK